MRHKKIWTIPVASLALVGVCLGGATAFAAGGDASDPLATLSYLEKVLMPSIVQQVEQKTAVRQQELSTQFQKELSSYQGQSGTSSDSSSYVVVTLSKGQQLKLDVGCEVMLRVGTATVASKTTTGLIDTTTGAVRNNGAALEKNHLYLATISDRSVKATADTVKVLVRGGYTLG